MSKIKNAIMIAGVVGVSFLFLNGIDLNDAGNEKVSGSRNAIEDTVHFNTFGLDMPDDLNFAGEAVPIEVPDIFERMDREILVNTYWHSNTFLMMKRAKKYFPVIEPLLKKHGVPDDFKYLAVIESGLQNVVSPAGATGFWQLMPGTAKDYGLEVNSNVDERYHIEKSTEAACEYIKNAKNKFGNWTMAAAAYNAGNTGIQRQLDRQKVDDYYDVLLGEETGRYLFRIMAMKEILGDPEKYGFVLQPRHYYKNVPVKEVTVDTAVTDMADFAKGFDINYKALKIHNPWLREANLNNKSGKKYIIKIPEKGYYDHAE